MLAGICPNHWFKLKFFSQTRSKWSAKHAFCVSYHKIYLLTITKSRRAHYIAFIFSIFIIYHYYHFAVFYIINGL